MTKTNTVWADSAFSSFRQQPFRHGGAMAAMRLLFALLHHPVRHAGGMAACG